MYKFAKMNNEDRDFVFNNVAMKKGIHKALVEKDFWVCLVLDYLFTRSKFKSNITFKGGTSLSKGFNIINRFSEDIDIILDWGLLGVKGDEPLTDRSNTKQDKYNKELNDKAKAFIKKRTFGYGKPCGRREQKYIHEYTVERKETICRRQGDAFHETLPRL